MFNQLIAQGNNLPAVVSTGGGLSDMRLSAAPDRLSMTLQGHMVVNSGDQKMMVNAIQGIPFLLNSNVGRVFYGGGEEMGKPPTCISNDGQTPDQSSPQLHDPSSPSGPVCSTCVFNQKGSGKNGSKACAFKMRIGILPVDGTNGGSPLLWRVPAMSIFAEGMNPEQLTIKTLKRLLDENAPQPGQSLDEAGFIYQFESGAVAAADGSPMNTILMRPLQQCTQDWMDHVTQWRANAEWRDHVLGAESAGGTSISVAAPVAPQAPAAVAAPPVMETPAPMPQGGLPPAEQPYPTVTPGVHQAPAIPTELQPQSPAAPAAPPAPPAAPAAPVVAAPPAPPVVAAPPAPPVAAPAPPAAPPAPPVAAAPPPPPAAPPAAPVAAAPPAAPAPAAAVPPAEPQVITADAMAVAQDVLNDIVLD